MRPNVRPVVLQRLRAAGGSGESYTGSGESVMWTGLTLPALSFSVVELSGDEKSAAAAAAAAAAGATV